ncbi:MAG: response regulator [Cellvibrionaceae bacterium]|nr:response regulator [Cellvibrionaceae bacterium]
MDNTATQKSADKGCVLIADDSKIVRATAKKMLTPQFDLIFAEDGEIAWQKLCELKSIQAVFTDLRMPNLDGYGLIKRIRQADDESIRQQPIIVMTSASEGEGIKQEVLQLGASDFICKPFKASELIARAEAHSRYRRDKIALNKNAEIDLLTNTLNAEGVYKRLEKDISFVNRHGEPIALVLFELDNTAALYREFGKKTMDMIVKKVASTLARAVRKEDSLGRIAAGQFLAILPVAKADGVSLLAQRICSAIKAGKVTINQKALQISVSAGVVAALHGSERNAEQLMASAKQALALAKNSETDSFGLIKLEGQPAQSALSIDKLLKTIGSDEGSIAASELAAAVDKLRPLVAMLSEAQKQRLLGE